MSRGLPVAVPLLRRMRLETALDRVVGRRVALIVGDTGVGKSTLLALWSQGINGVIVDVTGRDAEPRHFARRIVEALGRRVPDLAVDQAVVAGLAQDPDALVEQVGALLGGALSRDTVLALDNVHLLGDGPSARLLAGLVRQAPPLLHLVMAGRTAPPNTLDGAAIGEAPIELTGADLVLTIEEVAELVARALGHSSAQLAHAIHRATAGWPLAVRLSIEALDHSSRGARTVTGLDTVAAVTRLARSVYEHEPSETRRVLAVSALFEEVSSGLLAALGVGQSGALEDLAARGIFLEPGCLGAGWYRLHANVAAVVAADPLVSDRKAEALLMEAASWLSAHELPQLALRALMTAGRHEDAAKVLARSGQQLLAQGQTELVLDAISWLPEAARGRGIERLGGDAWRLRSQWKEALACYDRAAISGTTTIEHGLAWRIVQIHDLRGDPEAALAVYDRAEPGGGPSADLALLQAWAASAHWSRGDAERCGDLAVLALQTATAVGDPAALAAAHTVLGMLAACEGDHRGNDAHYLEALRHAERARDVLQLVRIRTNRGSRLLEQGAHASALAELDQAIALADGAGLAVLGALALSNRGAVRLGLGQLQEAQADLEASAALFDRHGSGLVVHPLQALGRVHHLRGDTMAATAAFERALGLATDATDAQGQVASLCGLARLLVDEDLPRATELARRAVMLGTGMGRVTALTTSGWVSLATGARAEAMQWAQQAEAEAAARLDRSGEAEALTLQAAAGDDPSAQQRGLRALALWAEVQDPIGSARAALVLARHQTEAAARTALQDVVAHMRAAGCPLLEGRAAAALARLVPVRGTGVRIETLGGFRVLRDGVAVPSSAWRSRKARDALKILVSRRGRAITREALMDLLWPGETPEQIGNRLNVLLSTIRGILDPERSMGPEGPLVGDGDSLRLDLDQVEVDIERFLADAAAGLRLLGEQRTHEAVQRLDTAEASYTGDFLEGDLYEEWAGPLREEARATYRCLAARLASLARERGDADAGIRYLLRSLAMDPYDERIHLDIVATLVASGRHGDARRHHRTYCARMEELGVTSLPFDAACLASRSG